MIILYISAGCCIFVWLLRIIGMKKYKEALSVVLVAILAAACGRNPENMAPQHVSALYRTVEDYASMTPDGRLRAFGSDSVALTAYAEYITGSAVENVANVLSFISESQPVVVFTPAVDSVYPSLEPVENALGRILSNAALLGIELPRRSYAAVVHGRRESVVFVDSVMLIALNHYLGADYPGYSHWPAYRRALKTPAMLPYDMAEAIVATSYPFNASEATVLSRMLYEGALSLVRQELAGGTEAASLGYDQTQMQWLEAHEAQLWKSLVGRGLLYDTSPMLADRLFAPAPATSLLDAEAPGRAGRFLGRRIVDAYIRRHPDTSCSFLLSPAFYASESVLADARYAPRD